MLNEKDVSRITALLNIVEKVSTVAPGYMHIVSEAMAELRLFNTAISDAKTKERGVVPLASYPGQPSDVAPVPSQPLKGDKVDLEAARQHEPTAEDVAKQRHEQQVLAAAADAKRRLDEAEAAKAQPAADKKLVSEADAIEKARRDEEAKKNPQPQGTTADRSDGMPSPSFTLPRRT